MVYAEGEQSSLMCMFLSVQKKCFSKGTRDWKGEAEVSSIDSAASFGSGACETGFS